MKQLPLFCNAFAVA